MLAIKICPLPSAPPPPPPSIYREVSATAKEFVCLIQNRTGLP
jgi:hypothetical protein